MLNLPRLCCLGFVFIKVKGKQVSNIEAVEYLEDDRMLADSDHGVNQRTTFSDFASDET